MFYNTVHLIRWLRSSEDNSAGLESARRTQTESFRGGGDVLVLVRLLQSQVVLPQIVRRVHHVKGLRLCVPTVPQCIRSGASLDAAVSCARAVFYRGVSHLLVQASASTQLQESFCTLRSKVSSLRFMKAIAAVLA